MVAIIDREMASHGDFILVSRTKTGTFAFEHQRLFKTEDDAIAAIPNAIGRDYLVAQITTQYRPVVSVVEVMDRRPAPPQFDVVEFLKP